MTIKFCTSLLSSPFYRGENQDSEEVTGPELYFHYIVTFIKINTIVQGRRIIQKYKTHDSSSEWGQTTNYRSLKPKSRNGRYYLY